MVKAARLSKCDRAGVTHREFEPRSSQIYFLEDGTRESRTSYLVPRTSYVLVSSGVFLYHSRLWSSHRRENSVTKPFSSQSRCQRQRQRQRL